MPTYQYACTACDHEFEAVQSFSDDTLTTCPACEGRLRKVFSAVGVVFKGSGFYRTDSRSAPAKDASSAESSATSGDAGKKDAGKRDGATKDGEATKPRKPGKDSAPSSGRSAPDPASSTAGHAA